MATELATAYITLIPSMKGAKGQIQEELGQADTGKAGQKAGGKFKAGLKSGMAGVGVMFAGAQVAGFVKGAVGAASDFNETASKAGIIFGENAGAIDKWASGAAANLGMSKGAALDAASGFGDMFGQLGFAGGTAADMSKQVVQMSADLGSFNNLPTEDVSERMSAAFRGEYDSLQTLIPNINATRVEQEALAKTGKKSAKELTAQEKAAAVLAIVQKDGKRATGDFARTQDGLANSSKIIGAQFEDIKVSLGQKLLPIVAKATKGFADLLGWFQKNPAAMKALALILGGVLAVALGAAAAAAWAFTAALLANPATWIAVAIVAAIVAIILVIKNWGKIVDWLRGLWDAFAAWFAGLWSKIVAGLRAVVGGIAAFFVAIWQGILAAIRAVWQAIVLVITTYINLIRFVITTVFNAIKVVISAVFNGIRNVIVAVWTAITNAIRTAVGAIKSVITRTFNAIRDTIASVFNGAKRVVADAWRAISTAVSDGIAAVVRYFTEMPGKIAALISKIVDTVKTLGSDLASGLIDSVRKGLTGFADIIIKPIKDAIGKVKGLLKIGSPSKVFAHIGSDVVDGMAGEITRKGGDVAAAMSALGKPPPGIGAGALRGAAARPGAPAEATARIAPEDIRALGEFILAGSARVARGEMAGLGRGLRAGRLA